MQTTEPADRPRLARSLLCHPPTATTTHTITRRRTLSMKKLSMLAIAATACGALTFTALETGALAARGAVNPAKVAKQQAAEAKRGKLGKFGTKMIRFGNKLRVKRNVKNNSKRTIAHVPRAAVATVWNPVVTWP